MITLDLEKDDLINLVAGTNPDPNLSQAYSDVGYMINTGGSWGCSFKWDRKVLSDCSEEQLMRIYKSATKE